MPRIRLLNEAVDCQLRSVRLDREPPLGPPTPFRSASAARRSVVLTGLFALHASRFTLICCLAWPLLAAGCGSAHWIKNGFLDPTQVGQFAERRRNEIRRTLSILEEPDGVPGSTEPTAEDLQPEFEESPIGPGDILVVAIYELQIPGVKSEQQIHVGKSGFETVQVLGPVRMVGFTSRELELELQRRLREAGILRDADVQVTLLQSQAERFTIIGSVARTGVYPLPGPDYQLTSAIAAAGGIPPTIETIHVFRKVSQTAPGPGATNQRPSPETTPFSPSLAGSRATPSLHRLAGSRATPPPRRLAGSRATPLSASSPEAHIRYTMSEVSTGPVAPAGSQPTVPDSATSKSGPPRPLQDVEAQQEGLDIEPEWDAQRGEWVLMAPETQPEDAPEHHSTSSTAPSVGTAEIRQVPDEPDEPEERTVGEADLPWEEGEQLGPPTRIIEIPVKELMEGDPRYDIVIRPNDLIRVAPGAIGEFFMMGNIARPGAYSLTGRRLTVKEAIASAGGFGPLAWPSRADLIRRVGPDEEEIIQLDLDAIFAGEAPDFYVKPSDIINVGTSPASAFFAVLRNAFRFTYGMGFVYDRNFADSDTFQAREQVKQRRNFESQQRGIPF